MATPYASRTVTAAMAESTRPLEPGPTRLTDAPYDTRLRLAFATVVARRPSALLIDADNRATGWVSLEEAVSSKKAFAVQPHFDLVCLDLDLDGLTATERVRADETFDSFVTSHPHTVVVASGRPGHRHAFWRHQPLSETAHADLTMWRAHLSAAGVDWRTTAIRPPLAPHRTGHPSTLIDPQDPDLALAWLAAPLLSTVMLSPRMRAVLRGGHALGGYRSASHARMAVAVASVAAGAGPGWLRRAFEDQRNALGESFRSRSPRWRDQEIERLFLKAHRYLAAHRLGPYSKAPIPDAVRAAVHSARLPGRAGATDLAVLEALVALSDNARRHPVAASLDQIAIEAGIHRLTARRSLGRLVDAHWIRRVEPASPTTATIWEVTPPQQAQTRPDAPDPVLSWEKSSATTQRTSADADLGADAARWGALGKARVRVLRELHASHPRTTDDIAQRLGLSPGTVRRHLGLLRKAGLAERSQRGWCRSTLSTETIAVACGTFGARDRQQQEYHQRVQTRARLRTLLNTRGE